MFATDLICSNGHKFEAWFSNHGALEFQRDEGLVICPKCGDNSVKQAFSPLRIRKHVDSEPPKPKLKNKASVMEYIEKHFEDVGNRFADEAMRIYFGESKKRSIRGTATQDEEQQLADDGIPFFKLPNIQ